MNSELKSRALTDLKNTSPDIQPLQSLFLKKRLKEIQEMEQWFHDKKWDSLRTQAHKWKGFCKPYGFETLGDLAATLENEFLSAKSLPNEASVEETLNKMKLVLNSVREKLGRFEFQE